MHRDAKTKNILLNDNGNTRLCDVGFSVYIFIKDDLWSPYCGNLKIMVPNSSAQRSTEIPRAIDLSAVVCVTLAKIADLDDLRADDLGGTVLKKLSDPCRFGQLWTSRSRF